jgi:hypothetical protein
MRLSKFWYGFFLATSLFVVVWSFVAANSFRGNGYVGGEVFMVALPLMVIQWRDWTVEQEKKERRMRRRLSSVS